MNTNIGIRRLHRIFAILVAVLAAGLGLLRAAETPPKPLYPGLTPACSCENLTNLSLPNTTIESAVVDASNRMCRVTVIVTHPPAGDRVKVWIGLPLTNWNGRFQGTGGGGFLGGHPNSLRGPVRLGFSAGATDTGHEGGSGKFALDANGRQDWQAIIDNAYLGIHEMAAVGKALTQAFYGKAPRYSYFVGGSTGGRQGLMEAQRFPDDYDGIVSACPAINHELRLESQARRRHRRRDCRLRRGRCREGRRHR
jgi:feruloyl esterase